MKNRTSSPLVLYIGPGSPELKSNNTPSVESNQLNVIYLSDDKNINKYLVRDKPDCIITVGKTQTQYTNLYNSQLHIRQKWLHFNDDTPDFDKIGDAAYYCAMYNILRKDSNNQLISFITPIYNTGEKLYNTYKSITTQTYNNWEWIIINDSNDGGKTLKIAEKIALNDSRVHVYDYKKKSGGTIGDVKYKGFTLGNGELLVELDHDDILTPKIGEYLMSAAHEHPECGFFYSDCIEMGENNTSLTYGDNFAFGYGKYRKEIYNDKEHNVCSQHNINPKTIRHIVGIPNHVRAWRKDIYLKIGGHNRLLTVADDYELVVRTFLKTKMCHIPILGYIQNIYNNGTEENTHNKTRSDIQRKVKTISNFYNRDIKYRFNELGLVDWAYDENPNCPLCVESKFNNDEMGANITFNIK